MDRASPKVAMMLPTRSRCTLRPRSVRTIPHWKSRAKPKKSTARITIDSTGWSPRCWERITKKAPPQTKNTPWATFSTRVVLMVRDMANASRA